MDIIKELERLRRKHYYCDDSFYSCPLADDGCLDGESYDIHFYISPRISKRDDCDCGANKHNEILDNIIQCLKAY